MRHQPHPVLVFSLAIFLSTTASAAERAVARFDSPELPAVASQVPIGGSLRLEGLALRSSKALVVVELERFRVFTEDARIFVHGDAGTTVLPAPANAYFRGRIAGEPRSTALLTVLERGGMRGIITSGGEVWVMATTQESSPDGFALRPIDATTEFAEKTASFACDNDLLEAPAADPLSSEPAGSALLPPRPAAALKTTASHTARVAIETDYEYYQRFGNVTAAADYAGDLIAYGSGIYGAEVDTTLLLSSLDLWTTTSDPWTQSSSLCALFQFGRYWNDNRGDRVRTIAHMLSGKSSNSGVGWVGVLCRGGFSYNHGGGCPGLTPQYDNYGGGYSFLGGIDGNFDINNPSVVWDIEAMLHEIGHNFNSPHTHCYAGLEGNAAPVDECYGGQCGSSGCYCGSSSLPCAQSGAGCGTIMSYCHLLSGGLGNISLTLGAGHPYGVEPDRVPTRMRNHVVSQAAFYPGCLDYFEPSGIFSDDFESGGMGPWSAAGP
ncbi:MAG: hypothetical protein GY856_41595 [bacterium]|nr:hypothetical protein [bacterium]